MLVLDMVRLLASCWLWFSTGSCAGCILLAGIRWVLCVLIGKVRGFGVDLDHRFMLVPLNSGGSVGCYLWR